MFFKTSACQNEVRSNSSINIKLGEICPIFTSKLILSSILLQSRALFIDLSRIPVNKGIKSRLGWTKHSDLYEILHLSLDLIFFVCSLKRNAGKVYIWLISGVI